jgi:hypothetical protein
MVGGRRIECTIAADADNGAAVCGDDFNRLGCAPRRLGGVGRNVGWDAVNLGGVKTG